MVRLFLAVALQAHCFSRGVWPILFRAKFLHLSKISACFVCRVNTIMVHSLETLNIFDV